MSVENGKCSHCGKPDVKVYRVETPKSLGEPCFCYRCLMGMANAVNFAEFCADHGVKL